MFTVLDIQFISSFFVFNDTATTEIYTLSLHDTLPISLAQARRDYEGSWNLWNAARTVFSTIAFLLLVAAPFTSANPAAVADRKSTRLNSSHANISYAVFCLQK